MRKPALGFIFVTLVLDILGIGLIIPILPKLIEQLSGGNTSSAAHTYGWLAAVASLMQFVCAPILGSLSDRFGRRSVILGSLFGSVLGYFLSAVSAFFVLAAGVIVLIVEGRRRRRRLAYSIAAPGWYPNPNQPGTALWWDGQQWNLP